MLKKILLYGLVSILVLFCFLQVFPIAFSAITPGGIWTKTAYFLTQSGGLFGTAIGVIVACYFYTLNEIGLKNKVLVFGKAFIGLTIIIGCFAAINEKFTKPILKLERPSHHEMLGRLQKSQLLDSLYTLSKGARIAFFDLEVASRKELFNNIDLLVLQHWIEEGGYSFPSGHTFNAFLLAMIFSFGIRNNTKQIKLRKLFVVPFIWAVGIGISRVALGAHTLLDVSAGAIMGVTLGAVLLYIDFTRHWVTHQKNKQL